MILGIPTFNQVHLTDQFLMNLNRISASAKNVKAVVIDNGSEEIITKERVETYNNNVDVIRNETNLGYFYPLKQLLNNYSDDLIGLCHNDITIYTPDWELRIKDAFLQEPDLGLLGFCGSDKIDTNGEMNNGLMGNFVETEGTIGQFASFARQVEGLTPAVCVDSLFMMFRRDAAEKLILWNEVTPYHWFDRFWSMMVLDMRYKIAVQDIKIAHTGGGTASTKEYRNFIGKRGDDLLYSRAKSRFLDLYGSRLPITVNRDWDYFPSREGGE